MITVTYTCPDGTPFPVDFVDEEAAALTWQFDRSHVSEPQTPLAEALGRIGHPGVARAYAECGLPSPTWRVGPSANGFGYGAQAGPTEEERAAFVEGCRVLIQKWGGAGGIWSDLNLPIVQKECEWLDNAGLDVPLAKLAETQQYAWAHTMISILVSSNDIDLVTAVIKDLYDEDAGVERPVVAFELTQGYPNTTVSADQDLWRLGQMVRTSPALGDVLAAGDAAAVRAALASLRATGAEAEFYAAFDAFLSLYGRRAEEWDISTPTWSEQGEGLWAQIRNVARDGVVAPEEALAKAAERRQQLIAELDARLPDDDTRARFHRRVERLASYVAVREERALWQLISSGSLRGAVLRRGADLVRRGVVREADDILYLLPEEIDSASGDLSETVADRRANREYWRKIEPPRTIGGDTSTAAAALPAPPDDGVLRGSAAARGVASGRARIVTDLADAARVERGDVLVCVMTSPPWTPLFSVVAAVVCNHGGAFSHAGIASREYGIPCVALPDATTLIPDGAVVTVDGIRGTVQIAG